MSLESNKDDYQLAIMPALVEFKTYLPRGSILGTSMIPYAGIGAGFYWARFAYKYNQTGVNGPFILSAVSETMNYYGYGGRADLGVELPLSTPSALSLDVSYDITNVGGSTESGGLGNIGGFHFGIGYSFAF